MTNLYNPNQVIAEMLRKVADGEEVNGQEYLDLLGEEHGKSLSESLLELSENWPDDNEISETVGSVLTDLANGDTAELGQFGGNGENEIADKVAMHLKELAAKLWAGGDNTPTTGMQPA